MRRKVGIIFQRPSLDQNLTGEENIRFHAVLYGLFPYAPACDPDGAAAIGARSRS